MSLAYYRKNEGNSVPRGKISERILRVLLNDPNGVLTIYGIAKKAEASYSWTYDFLQKLQVMHLVEKTRVKDYKTLFKLWFEIRKKPQKRDYQIRDALSILKDTNMKYALTTYQAENLVNKYLFPSRIDLYIYKNDLNKWQKYLLNKGLVGGGNFRLLVDDDHIFYKSFKKDKFNIVSIPQLIVDLYVEGGVASEAADILFEKMVNLNV